MESLLATGVGAAVGSFGVVVELMASAVLGASEDLRNEVSFDIYFLGVYCKSAYLVATGVFASVHPLALLGLADAVGGGSVGDRHGDLGLRASAHGVLAANHVV